MENSLIGRFPGVIGFPVTPFTRDGAFDEGAFRANVDFMLDSSLAALAFCGSNGELQSLTLEEYQQIAEAAAAMIQRRKGLILGAGQNWRTAEVQARIARRVGADAILLMAPYMNDPNEPGVAEYYRRVAGEAGIPVALYQTKWSGLLSLPLLERLADVENISMVKDEHGSLSHYLQVRRHFGNRFSWVNGMAEPFVPSYWSLGVTTFTSGLACFIPQVTMEIFEHASAGDMQRVNELLNRIIVPLYEMRNRRPGYKCSMIKAAMNLMGLRGGFVRPPLVEMQQDDRADLEGLLSREALLRAPGVSA